MTKTNTPLEDQPVKYCPRCRDEITPLMTKDLYYCYNCHIGWEIITYPDARKWSTFDDS